MEQRPVSGGSVRFTESLHSRLLIIIAITLLPVALLFGWYAWTQSADENATVRSEQQRRSLLRTELASSLVRQAQAALVPLSLEPAFTQAKWKQTGTLLERVAESNPDYGSICVADARGVVRAQEGAAASMTVGSSVAAREWFRLAVSGRGFAVGEYDRSGPDGRPTITFSQAIIDSRQRVAGVLGLTIPVSALRQRILQVDLAPRTTLTLLDDHGHVIIRQPDREGLEGKSVVPDGRLEWLRSKNPGQKIANGIDGRRALITYAPVYLGQGQGLYLVSSLDMGDLTGRARRRQATVVGSLALLAAATAGMAMLGSQRWVVRPIQRLVGAAHTLEAGDLRMPARLPQGSCGEFVQLKEALNSMAQTLEVKIEELEEARSAERHIADQLQQGLIALPSSLPRLEVANAYRSATEFARVGGDFYDLFELEDGRIGIVIGDVSGKGLDAAAFTSLVKNALRVLASEELRCPSEVIERANRIIVRETATEWFMTVFFGILNPAEDLLVYCNAGHTTGLLRRPGGILDDLPSTSPIVGAYPDLEYEDADIAFRQYDTLILYTDGLTEARRAGAFYGERGLLGALKGMSNTNADEVRDTILNSVIRFTGGRLSDDLALLVLRRIPDTES